MAETRRGNRLYWLDPEQRGVLPLTRFHLPRRLLRTVRSGLYTVTSRYRVPRGHRGLRVQRTGTGGHLDQP